MSFSTMWLGHASFAIKAGGKIIYIDPHEGEHNQKADLILVSHSHTDHCDPLKISRIRKDNTLVIAPADCASKIGGDVKSLRPGQKVSVEEITVKAVEAYNYKRFRSPDTPFHPKGLGVGYLVRIGDRTLYHAADTDFIPEMANVKDVYLALLPCGGTFTMDTAEAVEATLAIKPKYVIPMHRLETDASTFKKQVEARSSTRVVLLKPGEEFEAE